MKLKLFGSFGKGLMKLFPIKIVIIDDVKTYFNEQMISLAEANGTIKIERYYKCDKTLLESLINVKRDILILDIKGTIDKSLGKDGFDIARYVSSNSNTFIAITSAHKYYLKNQNNYFDYVLEDRLMTPIDFNNQLEVIVDNYLKQKIKFYQKIGFKVGRALVGTF